MKALVLVISTFLAPHVQAQELAPAPNRFQTEEGVTGLLAVGGTGMACYMAPCPWRGIAQADSGDRPTWPEPIRSANVLPVLIGDPAYTARVLAAWDSYDCLLIDGGYDGAALTIHEIVGPCA